jgi:hypothetical protein
MLLLLLLPRDAKENRVKKPTAPLTRAALF